MVSLVTLSIPIFLVLIGVELVAAKLTSRPLYRLNDTIDDLNCGVLSRVRGILTLGIGFVIYMGAFGLGRELGLPEFAKDSWVTWAIALLGVDFAYYWFHRLSHEVNFMWAAHIVHHQSEEYNLAVALRQSAFQGLFSMWFYAPLGFLGIPAEVYLVSIQLNVIYQFWIHTRLVGRLPWGLEAVLNTPSHHRVHHGADPKYLDRNYAGVLIIWDRMFGSFQLEEEEPTYGTTKPLARWNPVWANFDYWAQMWREAQSFERFGDKLRLLVKRPGWRPEQPVPQPPAVRGRAAFDANPATRGRKFYILAQFIVMLLATVALLFGGGAMSYAAKAALCTWILLSSMALGIAFESERLAGFRVLELLRLAALPLLTLFLLAPHMPTEQLWGREMLLALALTAGFSLISAVLLALTRPPLSAAAGS